MTFLTSTDSARFLALFALCGAGLPLAAGCTATETGNPVAQQSLALSARSSQPDVALLSETDAALRVTSAWLVLGGLEFVQSADCDRGPSSRSDIDGPVAIELTSQPQPFELALDATRYCRVRVRLEKGKELSGAPAELEDHSIVLQGLRADGVAFALRSRRNFDLDLRARGAGFDLATVGDDLILAFDLASWLDGIDLSSALSVAGEVIAVDDDHGRDRLQLFEDNVERALELFRDHNGDKQLDEDDLREPLAGGP